MPADPVNDEVDLDWTLKTNADGSALELEYTFTSHATERIYVCDQLTVSQPQFHLVPDRLIVMNGERPGLVDLHVGAVSPDVDLYTLPTPVYIPLDPGGSVRSTRRIPLPLTSWNNAGRVDALRGDPTEASLTVDWFAGEPASWRELHTTDGGTVKVPVITSLHHRSTAPLALPGTSTSR